MIVAAVILSGTLPGMAAFQDAAGAVKGITVFRDVKLTYPALIEVAIILLAAFLSFKTTNVEIRRKNHFTWGAIQEVAVLFIGIFITMQPALMILKAKGAELGITQPFQMFWATGFLSSFLDQHADLPGIPYHSRFPGIHRRYADDSGNGSDRHAGSHFPVVRYLWEQTRILEMRQTSW